MSGGGEDGYIVIPKKGQFNSGENFYSTLLHEMAHSTGEPAYLNREKGRIFGDEKYAREELVAELTAATTGQAMGISTHIREENAMYLKNWLGALKEDPKFIYSILSDVGKASCMIQEQSQLMQPCLSQEERFLLAVLNQDGKQLENMKSDGFVPSEKDLGRVRTNGITETGCELLAAIYGITVSPTSETATIHKGLEPQLEL